MSEFSPRRVLGVPVGDGYQSPCKTCYRARQNVHRDTNREEVREYDRAYREANREKLSEYDRKHYLANRERHNELERQRYTENPERKLKQQRDRYNADPEAARQRKRDWRRANPDKVAAMANRRRVLEAAAEGSHTEEEWATLKAKYNYTCLRCGQREPDIVLTRDHVIPLSRGGSDYISNIQPLCDPCNSAKGIRTTDYRPGWTGGCGGQVLLVLLLVSALMWWFVYSASVGT